MILSAPVEASGGTRPFTHYPAFLKSRGPVEAVREKGLVTEVIVRCRTGVGILTYSRVERQFCSPDHRCGGNLRAAIARTCK